MDHFELNPSHSVTDQDNEGIMTPPIFKLGRVIKNQLIQVFHVLTIQSKQFKIET